MAHEAKKAAQRLKPAAARHHRFDEHTGNAGSVSRERRTQRFGIIPRQYQSLTQCLTTVIVPGKAHNQIA